MKRLSKEKRLEICERIHELFLREEQGENVNKELRECGKQLGWLDRPNFLPDHISTEDYQRGLEIFKKRNIPLMVYKNRIRRGRDPMEAATDPYKPHNQHAGSISKPFVELAEKNGIKANTYYRRKERGWSDLDAATLPIGTRHLPNQKKK